MVGFCFYFNQWCLSRGHLCFFLSSWGFAGWCNAAAVPLAVGLKSEDVSPGSAQPWAGLAGGFL